MPGAGAHTAAGETPLALLTPQELVEALTVDEAVTLVVQQADGPPFGVELTPDPAGRAPEPLTISRPEPGVVVLRPAELAAENLAALDAALAELAGESPSALVLDLRDNPGGDRDTARRLAGRFLEGDAWVEGFLQPDLDPALEGLRMSQPFQPGKIPVVFVHGLASSPITWSNLENELRANPAIMDRYQIWVFRYDTGDPFLGSAARLRMNLAQIRQTYDPCRADPNLSRMALVGHSLKARAGAA